MAGLLVGLAWRASVISPTRMVWLGDLFQPNATGTSGVPRPVPSSLASKPSARRVWATSVVVQSLSGPLCSRAVTQPASSGIRRPAVPWVTSLPPSVLRRVPTAAPGPASRPGAGCQRRLSTTGSSASAAAQSPAPPRASTKTRFRRWARPKNWASKHRHAAQRRGPETTPASVHPRPRGGSTAASRPTSPARKAPKALSPTLRTPGTFSQTTKAGGFPAARRRWSIASTILTKRRVRLPRSSSRDLRSPATEKAWQGRPATITSGRATAAARSTKSSAVISPRFAEPGKRCAWTALAKGSISACHAQSIQGAAHSGAPMPLHRVAPIIGHPPEPAAPPASR